MQRVERELGLLISGRVGALRSEKLALSIKLILELRSRKTSKFSQGINVKILYFCYFLIFSSTKMRFDSKG